MGTTQADTTNLGLARPGLGDNPGTWDELWTQDSERLEARLATQYAGDPNGNVQGYWRGQTCYDTTNAALYVCTTKGAAATAVWKRVPIAQAELVADYVPKGSGDGDLVVSGVAIDSANSLTGVNALTMAGALNIGGNIVGVGNTTLSASDSGATLTLTANSAIALTTSGDIANTAVGSIAFTCLDSMAFTCDDDVSFTSTGDMDFVGGGNMSFGAGTNGDFQFFTNGTGSFDFSGEADMTFTSQTIVIEPYDGFAYISGLLVESGNAILETQFDATDATLANVIGANLLAGKYYAFEALLWVDADATGGSKVAIAGTATATTIKYEVELLDDSNDDFAVVSRHTAMASAASDAGVTAGLYRISGIILVNAAGTFYVQFAQSTANGTSSVLVGSYLKLTQLST